MSKVFGGLWLENLVAQDQHFELQCQLLAEGLIHGAQMRVAHPRFTPGVTSEMLSGILKRWPGKLFLHFGAENVGVDFGETLDEEDTLEKHGYTPTRWQQWNEETFAWGCRVALITGMGGVVHPGYGLGVDDDEALAKMVRALCWINRLDGDVPVFLENVPPIVSRSAYEQIFGKTKWTQDWMWGFGGLPREMAEILGIIGSQFQCLIDFSHLWVTVNQARVFEISLLHGCRDYETLIRDYLALPHASVCHFSGLTSHVMDVHEPIIGSVPPECLRDGIKLHEVVCLEIPFKKETARQEITWFRDRYLR